MRPARVQEYQQPVVPILDRNFRPIVLIIGELVSLMRFTSKVSWTLCLIFIAQCYVLTAQRAVLPTQRLRRTHMSDKFQDPFDGWGKLAERFCITFFMLLPSLLFMRVVLEWF